MDFDFEGDELSNGTMLEMVRCVQAEPVEHTHVVVMMDPGGVRLRAQTKGACEAMARILNGLDRDGELPSSRVLPRDEFLVRMFQLIAEEDAEVASVQGG